MKKRAATGFAAGLLAGLVFVACKLLKYSGGGRRDELAVYLSTILCFGVLGAMGGWLIGWIARLFGKQ